MKRVALACSLVTVLMASSRWIGAQQAPAGGANPARFTGNSTTMDGKDLSAARRHFDAGARTYWHSHDRGQLLMIEQGRMRTQKRGSSMQELAVGGTDYTPPNIAHWHGAAPDQPLVRINAGFGGVARWFEEVTVGQY